MTEREQFEVEFVKLNYQWSDANKDKAFLGWQMARAQPAQAEAVPLLSDEVIKAAALEAFDCTWDADDETLVNKYGHGVYLWRFVDFTRAIEQAVRAKLLGKEGA